MLIFAHLFVGAVIGILIAQAIRDNRAIYACILGSGISDIVDNPLGLIDPMFDAGRTVFHSLIVFIIFTIIGVFVWKYRQNVIVVAIAIGIFLHQIVDTLWEVPGWWFFPFVNIGEGHFINAGYFRDFFIVELTTLSEWIFFIAIAVMVYNQIYENRIDLRILISVVGIVIYMGIYSVLCEFLGTSCFFIPGWYSYGNLVLGIIAISGGFVYIITSPLKHNPVPTQTDEK